MKARNPLFDYLKGFAIVLVVLGHSLQINLGENSYTNPVFNFIYSFHMPLFMFISGYVSFESKDKSTRKLFQKFKSLIIPFCAWFIISDLVTYSHALSNGGSSPNFREQLIALIKSPDNGLWFLWVLFLNHVVLFIARKINSTREEIYLFLLLIIINVCWRFFSMDYLGIGLLRWHLLFFIIGYVMNKYSQFEKLYKTVGLIACCVFPALVVFWSNTGNPSFYDSLNVNYKIKTIITLLFNYLVAISGIMAVYTLFKWLTRFNFFIKKYFIFLGQLTLEIYCCHSYFLNLISTKSTLPVYLQVIISFILGLSGSLLLQLIIKKIPILPIILFGKEKKRFSY